MPAVRCWSSPNTRPLEQRHALQKERACHEALDCTRRQALVSLEDRVKGASAEEPRWEASTQVYRPSVSRGGWFQDPLWMPKYTHALKPHTRRHRTTHAAGPPHLCGDSPAERFRRTLKCKSLRAQQTSSARPESPGRHLRRFSSRHGRQRG